MYSGGQCSPLVKQADFPRVNTTLLKWIVTVAQRCVSIGTIANLLSSILTILLTFPNNDTLFCHGNDPLLTVYTLFVALQAQSAHAHYIWSPRV